MQFLYALVTKKYNNAINNNIILYIFINKSFQNFHNN